jgi:hypothetical protein
MYRKGIIATGVVPNTLVTIVPGKDQALYSELILNVSPHLIPLLGEYNTGVAAWNGLRDIFQTQAAARAVELRCQFVKLKKKRQETITEYLSCVRVLRDDIIMAGGNLPPEDVVTTVLAGLPRSYAMAVSLITEKNLKDLKLVQSKLTTEERRLRNRQMTEGDQEEEQDDAQNGQALYARRGESNRNSYGNGQGTATSGAYKDSEEGMYRARCGRFNGPVNGQGSGGYKSAMNNDAITQKSKHVDVHFHYVKTVVRHGKVMFAACSTAEQAADFLTKCLPRPAFLYCCQKCGMQ